MSSSTITGAVGERTSRRLLQLGVTLFFFGLITGFAVPMAANPRMALSSHLEGVLNGIFLLVLGIIWGRLRIGATTSRMAFALLAYGTFTNWATTLVAAMWGAGESMMPLAAAGYTGTSAQEVLIAFGLLSLSVAMIVVCPIILWGLRGSAAALRPQEA
jgi:hydroxylaminobenzene mutase